MAAVLTADIIAREAVMILENNLVMGNLVYRGYEDEFEKNVNGYKIGSAVRIRRPTDFSVRTTITAGAGGTSTLSVEEGSVTFNVDKVAGVDFNFTSTELSLSIGELSQRVIKPALVQIGNQIDRDVLNLFLQVPGWVATPNLAGGSATTSALGLIDTFAKFAKGPERLDLMACPQEERSAVLSPSDVWGLLGSQTALYMQDVAKGAYRQGKLGMIGNVDTYSSQNVQTLTTGTRTRSATQVNGANQTTSWGSTKTTGTMSLATKGAGTSVTYVEGDVFVIDSVFAVNPVTKATQGYLQPFVVRAAATSSASAAGTATLTISPPIIASGAFQTVSAAPADGATLTFQGGVSSVTVQNMVFHKNAFGLVTVPMEMPPGSIGGSRASYKGYSVRVIPYYDGPNDRSSWRLDVLYGVKAIDPRIAVRISGA